jgi:hypothetical protein
MSLSHCRFKIMNTHPSPLHHTQQARPPAPLSHPPAKKEAKYCTMQKGKFTVLGRHMYMYIKDSCSKELQRQTSNTSSRHKKGRPFLQASLQLCYCDCKGVSKCCKHISVINSSSSSKLHNQRITWSVVVGHPSRKGSEMRIKLDYTKAYVSRSVVSSLGSTDHLPVSSV